MFPGTVLEFGATGQRGPLPNLRLKARWGNGSGPVGNLPDVVTDADGRYTIPGIAFGDMVFLNPAPETEYKALCSVWRINYLKGTVDLPVVHKSWAGGLPPGSWINTGAAFGVVSERVDGQLQPIEGATVSGDGLETATTDARGFYMSCMLDFSWAGTTMTAQKAGYHPGSGEWDPGYTHVDFLLTRK
jgi:hypothetical protein